MWHVASAVSKQPRRRANATRTWWISGWILGPSNRLTTIWRRSTSRRRSNCAEGRHSWRAHGDMWSVAGALRQRVPDCPMADAPHLSERRSGLLGCATPTASDSDNWTGAGARPLLQLFAPCNGFFCRAWCSRLQDNRFSSELMRTTHTPEDTHSRLDATALAICPCDLESFRGPHFTSTRRTLRACKGPALFVSSSTN